MGLDPKPSLKHQNPKPHRQLLNVQALAVAEAPPAVLEALVLFGSFCENRRDAKRGPVLFCTGVQADVGLEKLEHARGTSWLIRDGTTSATIFIRAVHTNLCSWGNFMIGRRDVRLCHVPKPPTPFCYFSVPSPRCLPRKQSGFST